MHKESISYRLHEQLRINKIQLQFKSALIKFCEIIKCISSYNSICDNKKRYPSYK